MAVPTITDNRPVAPAIAAVFPFTFPGWTLPTGTWYFRLAAVRDFNDGAGSPLLGPASNEASVTLAAGQTPFIQYTFGGSPGTYGIGIWATQTAGDYSGATFLVDASQVVFGNLGSGPALAAPVSPQAVDPWFTDRANGHPSILTISGGTEPDRITLQGIVDQLNAQGLAAAVTKLSDVNASLVDGSAIWFNASITFAQPTHLDLLDESIVVLGNLRFAGTVVAPQTVFLYGGRLTGAARTRGPTIYLLSDTSESAFLQWQAGIQLYDAAIVDAAPAWNDASFAGGPWSVARQFDPQSLLQIVIVDGTTDIQACSFRRMKQVEIRLLAGALNVQDVGVHLVDQFQNNSRVDSVRSEEGDGFLSQAAQGPAVGDFIIYRNCRVLSRTSQDYAFESVMSGFFGYRLIDCRHDDATDDNDPVVRLTALFGSDARTPPPVIRVEHTVNVQLVDANGDDLAGLTVTALDDEGAVLFTATTDSEGRIPEQDVARDIYEAAMTIADFQAAYPAGHTAALSQHVIDGTLALIGNRRLTLVAERGAPWAPSIVRIDLDAAINCVIPILADKQDELSASVEGNDYVASVSVDALTVRIEDSSPSAAGPGLDPANVTVTT